MINRTDIVGYVRQPSVVKLMELDGKGAKEQSTFKDYYEQLPKIDLQNELCVESETMIRLNKIESEFVVSNPEYWGLYQGINLDILYFAVTIPDTLAQYLILAETHTIRELLSCERYQCAYEKFEDSWSTFHNVFLMRDIRQVGYRDVQNLLTQDELRLILDNVDANVLYGTTTRVRNRRYKGVRTEKAIARDLVLTCGNLQYLPHLFAQQVTSELLDLLEVIRYKEVELEQLLASDLSIYN